MSCKDKNYPYPIENVSADGQIVTLHTGCGYVGISVADFKKGFNLGILAELFNFDDGTIVMVEDGDFVVSPLSYDAELDSIVSTKRIIADEIQLSADTIELSQRLTIGAAGTIVEYFDEFLSEQSTPVITKYDRENGTLGTYSRDIGAEQSVVIQPTDAFLFTGAVYNPAPTTTTTRSNVNGIQYKFKNAGLNCRIKGTVTTTDGETRNLFGTDARPYNYFVTTGGTNFVTFVKYVGGIGNFPGYIYDIYIEAYDPETNEATGEPLNMYGNIVDGVFTSYAKVFFQLINDIPFGTGGDVAGFGTAAIGDIAIYKTEDGKEIQTSSKKVTDFVLKDDPSNKQSINIIANTVDIYEPDDIYNHYFYIGLAPALVKLKNPNDDYSEQDRFQVFNDSGNKLIIADNDDVELQVIQGGQAYEFFYLDNDAFTGWKVETLRTRSRDIVEYDVSSDATPTLGPDQVGPLISITQSGNITIPMVFSLEAFDNFQTGDVIEISASNAYTNYFFGVLYTSSIGQQLVVYPNNSCRLTRTDTSWDVQQDGTFLRTGIRSSTSRNTPLEPDGSAMIPVNGISVIDLPDDIASYIEDAEGHRVMQLDFTGIAQQTNANINNTYSFSNLITSTGQSIPAWISDNPGYTPQQFLAAVFSSTVLGGTKWVLSATTSGTSYNGTFPGSFQQVEIHRNGDNTRCFLRAYDKESNVHYFAGYKAGQDLAWKKYAYDSDVTGLESKIVYDNEVTNITTTGQGLIAEYVGYGSTSARHNHNFDGSGVFWLSNFQTSKRDKIVNVGTSVGNVGVPDLSVPFNMTVRFTYNADIDKIIQEASYTRADIIDLVTTPELVESFEANNDLILAPNDGEEVYLKDSNKDLGYGLNNVSTYFQPSDGPIDLNASTYLDYGQMYAVHKNVNSNKCLMMIHETLVAELWGNPVDDIDKLSMVIKSGAKAALGMANKTAPTGGVWNYQGYAIDIATTSDNANTTNPTKYLKDDGTEATVIADYARAIYSSGPFKNDGTTLLARGVVNFTADTATPNTFTADDTSDYFVCSVTVGGGTFNQLKMMPVFMTKTNNLDMYDKKAVLFNDAASAVGELLTICYEGAEEASAIAEAAKTSDSFGEFKQKIEDTTITLTETL